MTERSIVELPAPKKCPQCGHGGVKLVTNAEAFGANAYRGDHLVYFCAKCRASVGVHPGTTTPLGYMASPKIRALRAAAHVAFDTVWKFSRLTRTKAYRMLAEELGIPENDCHIGMLSEADLRRVIGFAEHYQSTEAEIARRREEKKNAKRSKAAERESVRANRERDNDFAEFKDKRRKYTSRIRQRRFG